MTKVLMKVVFLAQRSDFRGTDGLFLFNYFVVESDSTFFYALVLQEKPVILRKWRFLREFLRRFDCDVTNFALEVADNFKMELAIAVLLNGEAVECPATAISLDELSLKNLNSPQKRLVVFADVADLVVETFNRFMGVGELHLEIELVVDVAVKLFLKPKDFLLEDED